MPDPAKSVGDIDDVLSSIRRLVAEQPSSKSDQSGDAAENAGQPAAEERLVLTPALRVTETDTGATEDPNQPDDSDVVPDSVKNLVSGWHGSDAKSDEASADAQPDVAAQSAQDAAASGDDIDVAHGAPVATPDPATEPPLEVAASDTAHEPAAAIDDQPQDTAADDVPVEHNAPPESTEVPAPILEEVAALVSGQTGSDPVVADDVGHVTETPERVPSDAAEGMPHAAEVETTPDVDLDLSEPAIAQASDNEALDSEAQDIVEESSNSEIVEDAPEPELASGDGWRPEMRLFDWDATVQSQDGSESPEAPTALEFESETGDANWPDASADRALLDLAAARETAAGEAETVEDTPADQSEAEPVATAAFTPIFSRRSGHVPPADPPVANDDDAPAEVAEIQDTSVTEEPPVGLEDAPTLTEAAEMAAPAEGDLDEATDSAGLEDELAAAISEAMDPIQQPHEAPASEELDDAQHVARLDSDAADLAEDSTTFVVAAEVETQPDEASEGDTQQDLREDPHEVPLNALSVTSLDAARVRVVVGATPEPDDVSKDTIGDDPGAVAPEDGPSVATPEAAAALDPSLIDEDMLRRIVAQAVREELQGALGERITRNVRKLVRREIRLVLAADELD